MERFPAKRNFIRDHSLGPFHLVETADGSLTACFGEGETMHSLRGAFNETVYIYGTALDRARTALQTKMTARGVSVTIETPAPSASPRTLSLGLGLGYVEILSAAYAKRADEILYGESFESVPDLTESFKAWILGRPEVLVPHSLYDDVAARTSALTGVSVTEIRNTLQTAIKSETWRLRSSMTPETEFEMKFHCVAFDAFSSKSTPELWSRDFLDRFLRTACASPCVLSTYACTGHLKRALKDAGFELEIREGYASKRDSTLAIR